MELQILARGATYTCDCARCGATMVTHEWAHHDHNERRAAMEAGTLRCEECSTGRADPSTFRAAGKQYAARYSAPGYLDCTEWLYDSDRRALVRDTRALYGDEPEAADFGADRYVPHAQAREREPTSY